MEKITTAGSLHGAVAVISGGLGDIGRATAHALRAAGAQVALSDLASPAIAKQAMPDFHYTPLDVTDQPAVKKWLDHVSRDIGLPSLIICNAGIVELGSSLEVTPEAWQRTLDINLSGAFFMAQAAARLLIRKKRQGRIVLVGSWAGHIAHTSITSYSVAKAGLRMAMECLAIETAPHGILVNEIAPGIVDAGLSGKIMARNPARRDRVRRKIPIRKMLTAHDVANGVLSLCHPDNCHMTGAMLLLDGGLSLKGPI